VAFTSAIRCWSTTEPVSTTADPAARPPLGSPLTGHNGTVWAVTYAPDRPLLASAGDDGIVRLWDLTSLIDLRDHVMKRACFVTGGGLSRGEWESYVPGLEYVDVCKNVTRPR
jgi:WD40 repeat protein